MFFPFLIKEFQKLLNRPVLKLAKLDHAPFRLDQEPQQSRLIVLLLDFREVQIIR